MKNDVQAPFPHLSKRLVKALNEVFKSRDFDTKTSLRELDFHFGQRSVVNFLIHKLEEQSENILKED